MTKQQALDHIGKEVVLAIPEARKYMLCTLESIDEYGVHLRSVKTNVGFHWSYLRDVCSESMFKNYRGSMG